MYEPVFSAWIRMYFCMYLHVFLTVFLLQIHAQTYLHPALASSNSLLAIDRCTFASRSLQQVRRAGSTGAGEKSRKKLFVSGPLDWTAAAVAGGNFNNHNSVAR
jgi:hypothetical protein